MTATSGDKVIVIETGRGVVVRTASDLRGMITELIQNSGEGIAFWAEIEAKRVADVWRAAALELDAQADAELETEAKDAA
jgi:hypothetical protein